MSSSGHGKEKCQHLPTSADSQLVSYGGVYGNSVSCNWHGLATNTRGSNQMAQACEAVASTISTINPVWVAAISAAIGALVGLGVVVRWCLLRRALRGSAAAIIALLGDPALETTMTWHGSFKGGSVPLSSRSKIFYCVVGSEHYILCQRDLDRLHAQGYVLRDEAGKPQLSRLGRILLDKPDNCRLLAKGVARARRHRLLRCPGGSWFRCGCETYRHLMFGCEVPLPYFIGQVLRWQSGRRLFVRTRSADDPR